MIVGLLINVIIDLVNSSKLLSIHYLFNSLLESIPINQMKRTSTASCRYRISCDEIG